MNLHSVLSLLLISHLGQVAVKNSLYEHYFARTLKLRSGNGEGGGGVDEKVGMLVGNFE